MKKLISVLSVAALIFGMSSCKSGMDITKRRYNKGYYVHTTGKHGQTKDAEYSTEVTKQNTSVNEIALISKTSITSTTKEQEIRGTLTKSESNTRESNGNEKVSFEKKLVKKMSTITAEQNKNNQKTIAKAKKKNNSAEADTIILVILSLFPILCLIAVYLYDGKTITTNFWVDLILHLTVIGAMIFALLVVLDVINLA